ncbi:MAG: hypothetical protein ACE5JN_01230 [Candidatus Methylomirabilia bacterium]
MGLTVTTLRLIIRSVAELERRESVLTYGIQDVYATYDELKRAFHGMRQPYEEVGKSDRKLSSSRLFQERPFARNRGNVDASVLFRMLGFARYASLDLLDLDGPPTIRHDLNNPIPRDWEATQDLVVDAGTIEHIFDIKTALCNTARLVRERGMVIHASPVLWYDHGFYGINPTLLVDFYSANGFRILDTTCFLFDDYGSVYKKQWCFSYDGLASPPPWYLGSYQLGVFFRAQRVSALNDRFVVPMQRYYATLQEDTAAEGRHPRTMSDSKGPAFALLPTTVHLRLSKLNNDLRRWRWFRRIRYRF